MTRLDAFLAHAGFGTRTEVKRLIRAGRVAVAGEVCRRAATHVEGPEVTVDGRPVETVDTVHAMLHKPVGYACSNNPAEAPLISELLPADWLGLGFQPAGRLDRDTSGLLILSRDGGMIHRLTHPSRKLPKRYRVGFTGELAPDAADACARGMLLEGEERPTRPAQLTIDGPGRATLILREGRTHQVRRMFAALGAEVVTLHRDRIGGLDLDVAQGPGEIRPLTPEDEARLFDAES